MWSRFVPQRNLDEVFGTSNEVHELLQAGFVMLDKRCVLCLWFLLYMPVTCYCSNYVSVMRVLSVMCTVLYLSSIVLSVMCVVSVMCTVLYLSSIVLSVMRVLSVMFTVLCWCFFPGLVA